MARRSIRERLAQLEVRKQALTARLNKQERSQDTRRKILLGALVLHHMQHGRDDISKNLHGWLQRELPGFLMRDSDKVLFDDILDLSSGSEGAAEDEQR